MLKKPTYLALGDSYTIGEGLKVEQNFPNQLSKMMDWQNPIIVAQTGWTTSDLLKAIEKNEIEEKFDFVSLLIGVNNQYQGKNLSLYRIQCQQLIDIGKKFALKGFFVVSIPDYGKTPFGSTNAQFIDHELRNYNRVMKEICFENKIDFVDCYHLSQKLSSDPNFLAEDLLHPNGGQYAEWLNLVVKDLGEKFNNL